jgi:hypothetical protein
MPDMSSRHHALLIGVNCYLPNKIDGKSYGSLKGCVPDIELVEKFLTTRVGIEPSQIVKLTSTAGPDGKPVEPAAGRPSYENIVGALKGLIERADPGDLVYVHYSGHGATAPTTLPDLKGATGKDETLVPYDIGDSAARYIRDHELALVFKRMVDKGLIATLVMDCCHSGGLTRGPGGTLRADGTEGDIGIRGVDFVDTTPRPAASLVGSAEELADCWRQTVGEGSRGLTASERTTGYTMLAACRPNELAKEYAFDGKTRTGALTYWMLDTLEQASKSTSWKVVHDRVAAKVRGFFPDQAPMLLGEVGRATFGSERVAPVYAVSLLVDHNDPNVLRLATGQAMGTRIGTQFAVYARGTVDFSDVVARLAVIEVTQTGSVESDVKVVERFGNRPFDSGDQAVLLTAPVKLIKKVRFIPFSEATAARDAELFKPIRSALTDNGWIEETETADEVADYTVVPDAQGKTAVICRPDGTTPILLRPPVNFGDARAAGTIVRRLEHLARFEAVRSVDNFSGTSPLRGKIQIDVLELPADFEDGADDPERVGKPLEGPVFRLRVGQKACLRISNASVSVLNLAILNLRPTWEIKQIHPEHQDFETLRPTDRPILLPITADLVDGVDSGVDIIKVLATIGPANFRALELPALDQPSAPRGERRGGDVLDRLMSEFQRDQPTRAINVSSATREWTTAQAEVVVER